jgi:nucleotide-binding universal stress UspA family protein
MPKVIVSYDGSTNDEDALAFGRLLAGAGADIALAYVRHSEQPEQDLEALEEKDAEQLLERGARSIGDPDAPRHVIVNASTPDGLRQLAEREHADVVVFGSDYRTAEGAVQPQSSAQRLLNGGPAAVAIAPAGMRSRSSAKVAKIGVIAERGDSAPAETAQSLAAALGATVTEPGEEVDLLVVGSSATAENRRVTLSAAAEYAVETATSPVIAVARGTAVGFATGLKAEAKAQDRV